jgi:hypothetical protein
MKSKTFFLLARVAAALVIWAVFPKPWLGFTAKNEVIGSYYSFEGCKREAGKRGGWYGKGCVQYATRSIANCDPLVEVSK